MAENERGHYWIEVLAGPVATLIGFLVAGIGVAYTVDASNEAERTRLAAAAVAQQEEQSASFELAAAELVMAQPNCALAAARSKELVQLFPTRLKSPVFKKAHSALKDDLRGARARQPPCESPDESPRKAKRACSCRGVIVEHSCSWHRRS